MQQGTATMAVALQTAAAAMVQALSRAAVPSAAQVGSVPQADCPAAEKAAAFERRLPKS
jgi:hypothetical protein